jgi:predicted lipid carrier protein YhbT
MLNPAALLLRGASRCLPLTRHVPFVIQRLALQQSLNRLFAVPLAEGAFDILRDRWLGLKVRDLQLEWFLTCTHAGLQVASRGGRRRSVSVVTRATFYSWSAAKKTPTPCSFSAA